MSNTGAPIRLDDYQIADLTDLAQPLLDYEDIAPGLSDKQETRLVEYVRACFKLSHQFISRRYDAWQEADRAHDVYVNPDATAFREKAVIADTRAIADTVVTYQMAALAGRNPMFQLEGTDRKSRRSAAILERLQHQHMRRTAGEAFMAQMFLDSVRYGFAPTKIVWDAKANTNRIINFDPRRCFPDPRVSWGDWDEMQFVGFTDYASTNSLLASGHYARLQSDPGLLRSTGSMAGWEAHNHLKDEGRGYSIDPTSPHEIAAGTASNSSVFSLGRARIIDELWVRLNGFEIGLPQLGMVYLVMTVLDEKHIVRLQLNPYGQQFPVVVGGLFHDRHKTYSQSLYDLLLPLHDIATWLLRSRIDNVQAALSNLMFVDPTAVSIPDLIERNPWGIVRTLPGANPGDGVFVAEVPDVTRGHWNDIAALSDLKQRVSAASDAQQGMPTADGIRSATEIARLTQLGSQRLGVLSRITSALTVRPMVRMMVSNIQDAIRYDGAIRLAANDSPGLLSSQIKDGYLDFDIQDLQGDVDYLVVDGTLPIEPTRNAETWMTMLQAINATGLNMEYDAGRILEEAIRSMGVSDLDQFKISPEQAQQGLSPSQQIGLMEKQRGASSAAAVRPENEVLAEAQKGNVISMSQAAGR